MAVAATGQGETTMILLQQHYLLLLPRYAAVQASDAKVHFAASHARYLGSSTFVSTPGYCLLGLSWVECLNYY